MPFPLAAKGAVVATSVAIATAVAIYESPEVRRYADNVRRRVAVALHSMGDGINPPHGEPLFNRPEDAHGFMQSRADPGVDADEETRRRQREELIYWNTIRLSKEEDEARKRQLEGGEKPKPSGTFDDFLRPDEDAEKGAYVFNTGANVKKESDGLRRRGHGDGPRGFTPSAYANPFSDEHHIGNDDLEEAVATRITPDKDEIMSDIYSATTADHPEPRTPAAEKSEPQSLIDLSHTPAATDSSATVARGPEHEEYMTAGQDDRQGAYASIQAWAQDSAPEFYSPLPSSPAPPSSGSELASDGQLTPTDSMSIIGSGEGDIGNDMLSSRDGEAGRPPLDVASESDGMLTPSSWSDIGSSISESDAPVPAQ